jgi:hypothetical protein
MTTLNDILKTKTQTKQATDTGTKTHLLLQHIVIDNDIEQGNETIVKKIKQNPVLIQFFNKDSKTEVPIAGTINRKFISRRIDRLNINKNKKHIDIIDYKTDTNPEVYRALYITQVREYTQLLKATHPDFTISTYILWTHDFSLEKIS